MCNLSLLITKDVVIIAGANRWYSDNCMIYLFNNKAWSGQASRVAQWKRAGPITQRSVDRNHSLLAKYFISEYDWDIWPTAVPC